MTQDLLPQIVTRVRLPIARQAGSEESTLTVETVALRAMRFRSKKSAAQSGISGRARGFAALPQASQVGGNGADLIGIQNRTEGGHTRSGNAIMNNAGERGNGRVPEFGTRHNVGRVFAALAV